MNTDILRKIEQCFSSVPMLDRRAHIGPREFLVSLVFCLHHDSARRTLAGLRRQLIAHTNKTMAVSTFWQRLATARLYKLLCVVIAALVKRLRKRHKLAYGTMLRQYGISGIFLIDASVINLAKKAQKNFPAPKNNGPAGCRWHLCLNLINGCIQWFCLTDGCQNEQKFLPPFTQLKTGLIIMDLGYWNYTTLASIEKVGAFYLSRIKKKAAIEIIGIPGKGRPSKAMLRYLKGNLFDFDWSKKITNTIEFVGAVQLEKHSTERFQARIVGVWNPQKTCYHWYVTNLKAPASSLYPLYRLRWQIELAFKATKNSLRLAEIPGGNEHIIKNLFLMSLIAFLCGPPLIAAISEGASRSEVLAQSLQRTAKIVVQVAKEFKEFLVHGTTHALRALLIKAQVFRYEAYDPNYKKRYTSSQRVVGF